MTIHQNLKELRKIAGITQEEVAQQVGLTRQAISSYEAGRTRPDLEMLGKLAALYQTDLPGILYGCSEAQKRQRRFRQTVWAGFAAVLALVLLHSILLLAASLVFPMPYGLDLAAEGRPMAERHFALREICDGLDGVAQAAAWVWSLLLAVQWKGQDRLPGAKQVSLVLLAFTGGFLLCTLPFCLPDPVYAPAEYLWAAKGIFPALFLLLSYGGILAGVRRRKRKETR